jgi:hypothetical protein
MKLIVLALIVILTASLLQAALPKDERVVLDRTVPEYRQLNAIGVVTPIKMESYGTGFLVDMCHVLTNHHVVFEEASDARLGYQTKFSVGQTTDKKAQFRHVLVNGAVIAFGNYDGSNASENADWVIIELDQSLGKSVGFITIYQMTLQKMFGRSVITAGFPGNRTRNGADLSNLYGDLNCKIFGTGLYGNSYHTCQTTHGQSGSPILAKGNDGKYYAIAIADRRFDMTRSQDSNIGNIGVSLDSGLNVDVVSDGDKIVAALKANPCTP